MHVTIINDCHDENAAARQLTRVGRLFPQASVSLAGVSDYGDLSAAGMLIDVLDAGRGGQGVVLVNVAPRHKGSKKWPNGTPFGYFRFEDTLVVSSVDGLTLSLVKKLGVAGEIHVLDVPTVAPILAHEGVIDEEHAAHLLETQFRSFDFTPFAAAALAHDVELPSEELSLGDVSDAPAAIWWVDNFGNCKTTLLPQDVGFVPGRRITLGDQSLTCYGHLKDVPKGEAAPIEGSSGLPGRRFLEIVVQGGRAEELGFSVGSELE
ncbi:hypothetical protein GVX82_02540 [Patescibacteria group bacterium]|jgi:hypothetical protein|nr:hypothetical protein [Patescibacteria group bacterium]